MAVETSFRKQTWITTPAVAFFKIIALRLSQDQHFGRYHLGLWPRTRLLPLRSFLVRACPSEKTLDEVGLLDEAFMYGEDIDLSYRINIEWV